MTENEGVGKFGCSLNRLDAPLPDEVVSPLFAWRFVLRRLGCIGQTPGRYGGYGYGSPEMAGAGATSRR